MISPNVNPNGDTQQALLDQMTEARRALLDAVTIMKAALPHGRNYVWCPNHTQFMDDRVEAMRRIEVAQDLAELYYQDAIALVDGED